MEDRESRFNVTITDGLEEVRIKWQKEILLSWKNTWVCREELTVLCARAWNENTLHFWQNVCFLKIMANQTNVAEKRKLLYIEEKLGCLQASIHHVKIRGSEISAQGFGGKVILTHRLHPISRQQGLGFWRSENCWAVYGYRSQSNSMCEVTCEVRFEAGDAENAGQDFCPQLALLAN